MQQAVEHRVGAFAAAGGAGDARVVCASQTRPIWVVLGQTDHQPLEGRVTEKTAERVFEHRALAQPQVLLGTIGAHPRAHAGRRHDGPEFGKRGQSHWLNR